MGKATKIIIPIIIAMIAVSGCEYGYHSYKLNKVNKELKNTDVITNEKGGHDVTWDTIKTAAKSNDVLVVFVDSKTPYFNPVMKAVKEEMNKDTKNNPKVLVVDRHEPSSSKLENTIDKTVAQDSTSSPYVIAYKKNSDLKKGYMEFADVYYTYKVGDNTIKGFVTPKDIAFSKSAYEKPAVNEQDVEVEYKALKALFEGEWRTAKDVKEPLN